MPSDATHYWAEVGTIAPLEAGDREVARRVLSGLDGTRSVAEVANLAPGHRFEAYCVLAYLVRERIARATEGDELLRMARKTAKQDPSRARVLLERGIDNDPHHLEMLRLHAEVARSLKDRAAAAQSLKTLAHLAHESGDDAKALDALEQARSLAPRDPSILERILALALSEKRFDEAKSVGMKLVELYRKPGLHNKACDVLAGLTKNIPGDVSLVEALASSQADAGSSSAAIKTLTRSARSHLQSENLSAAQRLYERTLEIDPTHYESAERLDDLASFSLSRHRARRRRWLTRTAAVLMVTAAVYGGVLEAKARTAFSEAQSWVSQQHLVENRRYEEAAVHYQAVAARHFFTPTAWFDIPKKVSDLMTRARETLD